MSTSTATSTSTSTSTRPTFLLVPGHWHTPAHLAPLTHALTARNLPTRTLQLHTVGRKPPASPRPTYSDDVSVIYTAVIREILAGRDVVLVLHSYAGMPGAEAVNCLVRDGVVEGASSARPDSGVQMMPAANEADEGREEGVKRRMGALVRVVFIAAYIFPAKTPIDPKDFVGPENPGFSIDAAQMTHMSSPWHFFFNDLPLSAAKPYVDACAPTYYVGRMSLASDNWKRANVSALLCTKDNAVPLARAEAMWGWLEDEDADGSRARLGRIHACHTPWVSRGEEVADWLARWGVGFKGKGRLG